MSEGHKLMIWFILSNARLDNDKIEGNIIAKRTSWIAPTGCHQTSESNPILATDSQYCGASALWLRPDSDLSPTWFGWFVWYSQFLFFLPYQTDGSAFRLKPGWWVFETIATYKVQYLGAVYSILLWQAWVTQMAHVRTATYVNSMVVSENETLRMLTAHQQGFRCGGRHW